MSKYARKFKKSCKGCGIEFIGIYNQAYCTPACYKEKAGYHKHKEVRNISTATVGSINELRVSVYLMQKGWHVFRALSPSCICDLIIIKKEHFIKLEVRTGYLLKNSKISFPKRSINVDNLAVVLPNEIIFFPPLPVYQNDNELHGAIA